jgi:hypothetical protein
LRHDHRRGTHRIPEQDETIDDKKGNLYMPEPLSPLVHNICSNRDLVLFIQVVVALVAAGKLTILADVPYHRSELIPQDCSWGVIPVLYTVSCGNGDVFFELDINDAICDLKDILEQSRLDEGLLDDKVKHAGCVSQGESYQSSLHR